MYEAIMETYRRRTIQEEYNKKHNIIPQIAKSNIKNLEAAKDDDIDIFTKQEEKKKKKLKRMTKKEKEIILKNLEEQLKQAIDNWEFEKAAILRDQIKEITDNE
jgi:excinuclease ABC subunit B